jgi:hypothetical protein
MSEGPTMVDPSRHRRLRARAVTQQSDAVMRLSRHFVQEARDRPNGRPLAPQPPSSVILYVWPRPRQQPVLRKGPDPRSVRSRSVNGKRQTVIGWRVSA